MQDTKNLKNDTTEKRDEKIRQASAVAELLMEIERSDCPNFKPGTLNDLGALLYDLLNY